MSFAAVVLLFPLAGAGFFDSLPKHGTVLWIGAHSDDEALVAGSLLAQLSRRGYRLFVVAMTHGSSDGTEGHEYDERLAQTRRQKSQLACNHYAAHGCLTLDFSQPAHYVHRPDWLWKESAGQVEAVWRGAGMPETVRGLMQVLDPVVVLTLDPDHGMYGHPEHKAVARLVAEAAIRQRRPVYAAENRLFSITREVDPGPIAWTVPGEVPCGPVTCWQVAANAAAVYQQGLPHLDQVPEKERATFLRRLW